MKDDKTKRQSVELTDEQCDAITEALDDWATDFSSYEFGLPLHWRENKARAREIIRSAIYKDE